MESKEIQKQSNICTKYKPYAKKSASGITLIALVVTIIVLLILAGISINLILGDNGIIKKARLAKEAQEMAQLKEEAELVKATGLAENLSKVEGEYGKADLLEDLNNNFEGSTLGTDRITTSDGKYDIIVDDDLNITVEKSGEEQVIGSRRIIITSDVVQEDTDTYIELYFEIEGKKNFKEFVIDYLNTNIYPDVEDSTELETIITNEYNETFDDEKREVVQEQAESMGMTYSEYLRYAIFMFQIEEEAAANENASDAAVDILMFSKLLYGYYCYYFDEEEYTEATDLEQQALRIFNFDGSFDEAVSSEGTSKAELQQEAEEIGVTYEQYLRYMIAMLCVDNYYINVTVSNGDEFSVLLIEEMKSYPVTSAGEYTFTATMSDGKKGETTVAVKESEVYDPDGWEVAWTCTDGTTWSEQITNDGTTVLPTEGVIAKFYNTGNTITPEAPDGSVLESGPEYKLVIEGSGDVAPTIAEDIEAWTNTQYAFNTSEIIICNGIESFGDYAFFGFVSLETITIPDTVKSIGDSVFWNCLKLDSISIPEGITSIGAGAFQNCSGITEIIIPDSITRIEQLVFSGCTGLTSITIPENVTYIGDRAFNGCSGITEITIPDGVTEILYGTFTDCTSLASITIPDSVETIEHSVFDGCSELVSITLPSKISVIDTRLFQDCVKLKDITIPASVTVISNGAFSGCTALETVTMQEGVTSIYGNAFYNCTSLANISLPNSIIDIGIHAFYNCVALNSITIPSKVESISDSAFKDCSNLKTVTVLSTELYYVGNNSFMGLPAESYIYVPNSTIQAKFTDGTHYDSTKTTISIK